VRVFNARGMGTKRFSASHALGPRVPSPGSIFVAPAGDVNGRRQGPQIIRAGVGRLGRLAAITVQRLSNGTLPYWLQRDNPVLDPWFSTLSYRNPFRSGVRR